MQLRTDALCTAEDVINNGGLVQDDNDDNTFIENRINNITAAFNIEVGVNQFLTNSFSYDMNGNGLSKIYMTRRYQPLLSITSIYDDTAWLYPESSLIDSSDYVIVDGVYIQLLDLVFTCGIQNIRVSGTRGYAENSNEMLALKNQCIIEVTRTFNRRGTEDVTGITDPHGNVTYIKRGWTEDTKNLLDSLKVLSLY